MSKEYVEFMGEVIELTEWAKGYRLGKYQDGGRLYFFGPILLVNIHWLEDENIITILKQ